MGRWRLFAGVILMALSVAGLAYWEMEGRSLALTEEVIAAGRDIQAGTVIEREMLCVVRVARENRIASGLRAGEGAGS